MAWLENWAKRIKLTIDHERVDEDLTDFPVLVTLASGVGRSSTDVTDIFDELSTVSGTKKIAITTDDGTTKCYTEIEKWDWVNEQAYLWTKIPTIVSGTDTDFYLYYDKDKLDNDVYVGDVGSNPGQNVWNINFKLVPHMGEDPSGGSGCIKDSTSNYNHGTPAGMASDSQVDGKIGKCLEFDGTTENVNHGAASSLNDLTLKTVEVLIYPDNFGELDGGRIVAKQSTVGWTLMLNGPAPGMFRFLQQSTGALGNWTCPFAIGTSFQYIVATMDLGSITNKPKLYINGESKTVTEVSPLSGSFTSDAALSVVVGDRADTPNRAFDGKIDEVRISDVIRTDAWIKATYYNNWDNLIVFSEPYSLVFTCSGTVQVDSILTDEIDVRLYRRSTGELVEETTTASGGLFEIDSYYDEDHYVVALYTMSGTNALIYDYISP